MLIKRKKTNWSRLIFIYTMIFYPVLHFSVFTLFINYKTIEYSFKRWNQYTGNIDWVFLDNYKDMIESFVIKPEYKTAMINTLLWIPLNILVLLPLSIAVAFILSKRIRFHSFYRLVYFFPVILSIVILGLVFGFMVSPINGIVNPILGALGLESLQHSWLGETKTALGTIFFFCVWAGIGFNSVLLLGAISRIPVEIFEVGKIEGITIKRELFSVVIPMIWSAISMLVIIGTSSAFTIFIQSFVLTGGGPASSTNTVSLQIYNLVKLGDYGTSAALGIMLGIVGSIVTLIIKRIMERTDLVEY
jgi:ABC-type sugar transport system permease subunit